MSSFRRFFGLLLPMTGGEPPKPVGDPVPPAPAIQMGSVVFGGSSVPLGQGDIKYVPAPPKVSPPIEPKSLLPVGVWFGDAFCWAYRGTLPVLLQFHPKTAEHVPTMSDYVVSRCPSCESMRLRSQHGRIKRWMILPL